MARDLTACPHCGGALHLTATAPATPTQRALDRAADDPLFAVVMAACAAFSARATDVLTGSRATHVVRARAVAAYVLRHRYSISYPQIGKLLGTDHATAMQCCRRVVTLIGADQAVTDAVARMMDVRGAA